MAQSILLGGPNQKKNIKRKRTISKPQILCVSHTFVNLPICTQLGDPTKFSAIFTRAIQQFLERRVFFVQRIQPWITRGIFKRPHVLVGRHASVRKNMTFFQARIGQIFFPPRRRNNSSENSRTLNAENAVKQKKKKNRRSAISRYRKLSNHLRVFCFNQTLD